MKLRNYQIEISNKGAGILNEHGLVYLSMEVRTGKTITALTIAEKVGAKKILFVTKKKAIRGITDDFKFFPNLEIEIINFESVFKSEIRPDLVIIDEAHSLGAYPKPSKRTKNLKVICKGKKIIFLSGTPTPESFSQIFHQLWVSDYSPFIRYKNFYKWSYDFVEIGKKYLYNREINDYSNAKIEKIEFYIKHLFISYTQSEAGFEVKLNENILYVPMDKNTKICHDKLFSDLILIGKNGVVTADTAVKMQSKIHQICSGTVKDDTGNIHFISDTKARYIKSNFEGKKIAIFYKFIGEFDILKNTFDNWTSDPVEFQTESDTTFLGQFVSSREGIRLDKADAIIFYNIDFSYLSYSQAKNRIISKERKNQANLFWIFTKGGIEEKIYRAVRNKSDYTNYYFKKDYAGTGFSNKGKKRFRATRL